MLLWLYSLKEKYDQVVFNFKNSLFENHYSRLGYYDKTTQIFSWIYDYDNLMGFLITLFNRQDLLPYDHNFNSNHIYVGTCYHKNQVDTKIVCNLTKIVGSRNVDHKNIVYFVIDEKYDLTQEYKAFKTSLINFKELSIIDIVHILCGFFNCKKIKINDASVVKILTDDHHFEELIYDLKTT
jgi:hypothetical protein